MNTRQLNFGRSGWFPVTVICLAVVLLLGACSDSTDADKAGAGPATIAIMGAGDFVPDQAVAPINALPDALAARIAERLTVSKRFVVVERTALRRVVLEQRFGEKREVSDVDRLLDKAVADLEQINAHTLAVAGGISRGNDVLRDFQDLGTAVGADYLVYAKLEKLQRSTSTVAIPYSKSGKTFSEKGTEARLYLRVVDVSSGTVMGAASLRTAMTEAVLAGQKPTQDDFSIFDEVGRLAANQIIDMVYPARLVSSDPWVINRGTNDGVKVGDVYNVFREGKEILDANGVVLGKVKSEVGQIELAQVQETLTVITPLDGQIAENDLVELVVSASDDRAPKRGGADLSSGQKKGKAVLAVGTIRLNRNGNNQLLGGETINRVTDDLIVKLDHTRRFDVLERQEIDQILDEKTFTAAVQGGDLKASLKQLEGADYLVYGEINDFFIISKTTHIAALDTDQVTHTGIVEANLRMVDVHSGKIVATDKIRINKKLTSVNDQYEVQVNLLDQFTSDMVNKIVTRLYPIKVLGAAGDGAVYINSGKSRGLKAGDRYKVLRAGEVLIDPDTGIEFGKVETPIGEVELSEVEAGRSQAIVISGEGIVAGDILRKIEAAPKRAPVRAVNKPNF
ncbi:MAG: hypothetical protein DRQ52_11020 [Gammaproteobacteria bacterium]|nr:MAG: hypothetical protein DRQ52_11020 [Gammaproteobacteria bacterium]